MKKDVVIVVQRCFLCNQLRMDGKFIYNFCLLHTKTCPAGNYGKFERNYLKVSLCG